MTDLYVTDEMGRNVYYVYNMKMPTGGMIRTIKYDFGTKGYDIAYIVRDCLNALGYNDKEFNKTIYQYVSKENVINGNNKLNVFVRVDEQHVEPVILINLNGFFELVMKSITPEARVFQHWVNNEVLPALYKGDNMSINIHHNGGNFDIIESTNEEAEIQDMASQPANDIIHKRVVERVD